MCHIQSFGKQKLAPKTQWLQCWRCDEYPPHNSLGNGEYQPRIGSVQIWFNHRLCEPFFRSHLGCFLTAKTDTHREWIYAYTGPVQVVRTKTHLLEAVSPFYRKPTGRFYYTSDSRFGQNYKRVDGEASHAQDRQRLEAVLANLPSHLEKDHPFWTSKLGTRWLQSNNIEETAKKQLYNHSDYSFYDETDWITSLPCEQLGFTAMVWRHGQVSLIKLFGPKIIKDRKFWTGNFMTWLMTHMRNIILLQAGQSLFHKWRKNLMTGLMPFSWKRLRTELAE